MQTVVAIHDGTSQGWETAYLAFHVAARLVTSLLILSLPVDQEGYSLSEQSEKILTGGRAAGLTVETRGIEGMTAEHISRQAPDIYALLVPKNLPTDENLLIDLTRKLSCPIWLVGRKYEIRQLGVWLQAATQTLASRHTTAMARRLGQRVVYFTAHSQAPDSLDPEVIWKPVEDASPQALAKQVEIMHVDMLIFDSEATLLFQKCKSLLDCVLALYPPERAASLTSD